LGTFGRGLLVGSPQDQPHSGDSSEHRADTHQRGHYQWGRKTWRATVAASLPHDEAGVPLVTIECRQHHPKHHQADDEPRIKQYQGSYHFIPFLPAEGVLRR
jgi:hypothetical protein